MCSLLDVNVLVALGWSSHAHHLAAHRWFAANAAQGWASCLLTQAGFLRISLNPAIVQAKVDCDFALRALEGLIQLPHHQFIANLPALSVTSLADISPRIRGHNQVTDSVLLYIAHSLGMKLVTFDKSVSSVCPWPATLEVCPT